MEQKNAKKTYQDTLFRKLFSTKEKLIELFNALENTDYGPDTPVEITTLEDVVYVELKNDLGFVIANRFIVVAEHQSTINPNMPLRQLSYVARTLENLTDSIKLFGKKLQKIPAPEFYVIYTGEERWKVDKLYLSDSFSTKPSENSMELVVKVVDLSYNKDNEILKRSETLEGYSRLLYYIREQRKQGQSLSSAIEYAVNRCIEEDCLADFLRKHGGEIQKMLFQGITMEEFAELRAREAAEEASKKAFQEGRTEGREEGRAEGMEQGIFALIEDNLEESVSPARIKEKLIRRFSLDEETAEDYLAKAMRSES